MSRFRPFPIVGGSYTDDALPWAHQDTLNYLPVMAEKQGTRAPSKLEMRPALDLFVDCGGVHRGSRDVEGKLFVVAGNSLVQVMPNGTIDMKGNIPGTGLVSMTHNQIAGGNELVVGNGSSGYVYNTVTGLLTQITDDGFPGFLVCDFLGQRIVGVEPQRRYWFYSALVDASSYNTTDVIQAETSPDRIVGLIAVQNEVKIFGERTIESWVNSPSGNAIFQLQVGGVVEMGCAAAQTIRRVANGVMFLSDDGQVVQLTGYTPQVVSTRAMEGEINRSNLARAFAFTWEDKGHICYLLTFPDGKTWVFDVSQGEWTRFKSKDRSRWRINTLTKWRGDWYAGDGYSGNLYRMSWAGVSDGADEIERVRTAAYIYDASNRYRVDALQIEYDSGRMQAANQIIQLRYSHDGGRNWSDWRDYNLGGTGQFDGRALFRRLGIGRDFLIEVKDTSLCRSDLIAASIKTS